MCVRFSKDRSQEDSTSRVPFFLTCWVEVQVDVNAVAEYGKIGRETTLKCGDFVWTRA